MPEWARGKHLYIFAGAELLGFKECIITHSDRNEHGNITHITAYKQLRIKPEDGRCNGCGKCCNGCPFLKPQGCSFVQMIPFSCVKSICTDYEGCTEKLEVVE